MSNIEDPRPDSELLSAARLIGQSEDGSKTLVWAPFVEGVTPSHKWMSDAIEAAKEQARAERLIATEQQQAMMRSLAQVAVFRGELGLDLVFGTVRQVRPTHKANLRTFRFAGKPKFFTEYKGQLVLQDGETPWT